MAYNNEYNEQAAKIYKRLYRKKYFTPYEKRIAPQKTRATGARISEESYAELEEIAKKEMSTINFLICEAVNEMIKRYKQHEEVQNEEEAKWLQDFDAKSEEEQKKILLDKKAEIFDLDL